MDQLTNMYRNVKVQLGQIANAVNNRNQGDLLSKIEVNPREHAKAITLHSGKEVGELPVVECERECEGRENKRLNELGEDSKKVKGKEKVKENESQIGDTTPIPPPVPFPQRLKPSRNDKEFEKFVNIFKQLNINIPFVDAILQIPSYTKFLKEIMTKKRKLVDSETIVLTEKCSASIQNKLPPKLKDPGSFTVSCTIEKDVNVSIILGRPFLATTGLQEEQVEEMTEFLQAQVPYKRRNAYEELGLYKEIPPPSCEQAPWLDLKSLPKHLKYAFVREKETLPVIVNSALDEE
ncbi:uncharacterized protein [Coffea arabica]|uniref:Reverse transcriptase domain-containing protein n=1 Tax=Coffea arabica TaxID=13443 RepID=A0ABM4U5Y9_COFAR